MLCLPKPLLKNCHEFGINVEGKTVHEVRELCVHYRKMKNRLSARRRYQPIGTRSELLRRIQEYEDRLTGLVQTVA